MMNDRIEELRLFVLSAGIGAAILAIVLSKSERFAAHRRVLNMLSGVCVAAGALCYKSVDLAMKWRTGDSYTMSLIWVGVIGNSVLLGVFSRELRRSWKASQPKT